MSTNTGRSQQLGSVFAFFFIGAGLILVTQGALLVGIGLVLIGVVAVVLLAQRASGGKERVMWRRRKRDDTDGELPVAEGKGSRRVRESDTRRLPIPRPETALGGFIELVVIVAVALGVALVIQAWLVKPYQVSPTDSMVPTLESGERVVVNRFIYHFSDPEIGDIVVFHPPVGSDLGGACGTGPVPEQACGVPIAERSDRNLIKRIVAGPGDTLSVRNGHPVVNGVEKTDEPYIDPCVPSGGLCDLPRPIVIPPSHYFMMGDNRGASADSRLWGPVPRDWIIGKVFATYWPPDLWGFF